MSAQLIPIGNAVAVEATGHDPLSAARLALVQLAEVAPVGSLMGMSVNVTLIEPGLDQPWEATAYGALAE